MHQFPSNFNEQAQKFLDSYFIKYNQMIWMFVYLLPPNTKLAEP